MKLNLLPTTVSKGAQAKTAFIFSLLLFVLSILGTIAMIVLSGNNLKTAKQEVEELRPRAASIMAKAREAETVAASGVILKRNIDLAAAMDVQNKKYPEFYDAVIPYIPPYFRVNRMQVTPVSENSCLLTLGGVIQSFQLYSDAPLALLRIPGARTVSRTGYEVLRDMVVPNLIESDQRALAYRRDQGRKPPMDQEGPLGGPDQRLNYLISQATQGSTGFTGVGNFGNPVVNQRSALPEWQNVQFTVLIERDPNAPADKQLNVDFRTPNPRESLKPGVLATAGQAAPAAGPGPGGFSAGPGGPPPGFAGAPGGEE